MMNSHEYHVRDQRGSDVLVPSESNVHDLSVSNICAPNGAPNENNMDSEKLVPQPES